MLFWALLFLTVEHVSSNCRKVRKKFYDRLQQQGEEHFVNVTLKVKTTFPAY